MQRCLAEQRLEVQSLQELQQAGSPVWVLLQRPRLLCGMWNLPRPGIEPVPLALYHQAGFKKKTAHTPCCDRATPRGLAVAPTPLPHGPEPPPAAASPTPSRYPAILPARLCLSPRPSPSPPCDASGGRAPHSLIFQPLVGKWLAGGNRMVGRTTQLPSHGPGCSRCLA